MKHGSICERGEGMTILLDLEPDVEAQLTKEASVRGLTVPDYVKTVLKEQAKSPDPITERQAQLEKNRAAIAMLDEWDREDATDDPEEIARRQAEWEEFKKAMNESHTSNRIIYP